MSVVERVNKAWDRIDAWYKQNAPKYELPKGATDAELDELAKKLNVTLPEELRVSLKRHNGFEDGKWPKGCLCSADRVPKEWEVWTDCLRDGDFDDEEVESDGTFQAKWWVEAWVPIDADGGGNGFVIDLAPGPKGKIGQILFMDHEAGPSGPTHPDYAAYLEEIADQLEKGRYVMTEDNYIEDMEGAVDEDGEGDEEDEDEDGDDGEEYEEEEEEEEKPKNKKKVKK